MFQTIAAELVVFSYSSLGTFQARLSPFCLFLFNSVSGERYGDPHTPSIHKAWRCGVSN